MQERIAKKARISPTCDMCGVEYTSPIWVPYCSGKCAYRAADKAAMQEEHRGEEIENNPKKAKY
jgi:hypothetical protein